MFEFWDTVIYDGKLAKVIDSEGDNISSLFINSVLKIKNEIK